MIGRARFWLFSALIFALVPMAPSLATAPTISVESYRASLETAQTQLQKMEARGPRRIAPILDSLAQDQTVRRKDGKTQTASGDEFRRLSKELASGATREQVQRVRESIATRQDALDNWSRSTLEAEDAQGIMRQLEGSGQIRTGPTKLEQFSSDVKAWGGQIFKNLMTWLGSLFPAGTPSAAPANDYSWVKVIFTATVLALLAAIGYLVWRAVGGKIRRKRKTQGAFAFSPEDAELLLLPPDELRERAHRFAAEGNFREALRHLYISLLLNLDARGVWRYDARRTNWEHIVALKADAARSTLITPLSDITRRFDRVRYGNAPCEQNDWTDFERDVTALEASTPA